jgi:hypothetical protein
MTPASQPHVQAFAPIASMGEAGQVIKHLFDVMDAMLALIDEETKLVRAGKLSAAARLVPSKNELSQLYLADTQRLKAGEAFLARSAPQMLDALRKRHDLFRAVLQMNLTVLATAHAVSEGIMRRVSDDLARKSMPTTYGASGRTTAMRPRHAQPLTLSRVL